VDFLRRMAGHRIATQADPRMRRIYFDPSPASTNRRPGNQSASRRFAQRAKMGNTRIRMTLTERYCGSYQI